MRPDLFTDSDGESFLGTLGFHGGLNEAYRAIDIYAIVEEDGPDKSACRQFSVSPKLGRHFPHSQHQVTFRLNTEQAQQLMDLLWRSRVRPAEIESIGQVSAMEAHLADLRKLVFEPSQYGISLLQVAMERIADLQRQLEFANKTIQSLLLPAIFIPKETSDHARPE
jgi:hypothetical protein